MKSSLAYDEETIIAQCTPVGAGALALLRVSGTRAREIVARVAHLASGVPLTSVSTHTIHFGRVVDISGVTLDQVLFLVMHAPRTFTGQDTVEISCHNNVLIIGTIIDVVVSAGARCAAPGEFTQRAVMNNKIDMLQAEAINDLIRAGTAEALKRSLAQLSGSLSSWVKTIEGKLLEACALTEASFEFLDEDISFGAHILGIIKDVRSTIAGITRSFDRQQRIREGFRVAFIGSVNAGKSSLFNALLDRERAIVTEIPGTTRDTIEAGLCNHGTVWTLVDTAGIRESHDVIEKQGMERSLREAALADIVILVRDGSRPLEACERVFYQESMQKYASKIITVCNKIDRAPHTTTGDVDNAANSIGCSCTQRLNIECVRQAITSKVAQLQDAAASPFLLTQRQMTLLTSLEHKLALLEPMLAEPIYYELVALHLKDALAFTSDLTGASLSKECMDLIFRNFCVGK